MSSPPTVYPKHTIHYFSAGWWKCPDHLQAPLGLLCNLIPGGKVFPHLTDSALLTAQFLAEVGNCYYRLQFFPLTVHYSSRGGLLRFLGFFLGVSKLLDFLRFMSKRLPKKLNSHFCCHTLRLLASALLQPCKRSRKLIFIQTLLNSHIQNHFDCVSWRF